MRNLRADRNLLWFLAAYWLYIDGVYTIIKMAVDYGLSQGLSATDVTGAILLTNFLGFPAAIAFGALGTRIGPRRAIYLALAVYIVATAAGRFPDDGPAVLRACRHDRPGPGRRAVAQPVAVRAADPAGEERRVLRLLQHAGQVLVDPRAGACGHRRPSSRAVSASASSRSSCCSCSGLWLLTRVRVPGARAAS